MSNLSPTATTALEAVTDDELAEAADLCNLLGIPDDYARNLAAAIAVCGDSAVQAGSR